MTDGRVNGAIPIGLPGLDLTLLQRLQRALDDRSLSTRTMEDADLHGRWAGGPVGISGLNSAPA
jgi:hypothetical protein